MLLTMKGYQTNLRAYSPMSGTQKEERNAKTNKVITFPGTYKCNPIHNPNLIKYNSLHKEKSLVQTKKEYSADLKKYTGYSLNYQPMAKSNKRRNVGASFGWIENAGKGNWIQVISQFALLVIKRIFSPFVKPK